MKGLDPLIAEVLLVVIVLTAASLIFTFLTGFSQKRTQEIERQQAVECYTYSKIRIIYVTNNKIIFSNMGSFPLTNISISADGNTIYNLDILNPNEIKSIDFYRGNNKTIIVSGFCKNSVNIFAICQEYSNCWS